MFSKKHATATSAWEAQDGTASVSHCSFLHKTPVAANRMGKAKEEAEGGWPATFSLKKKNKIKEQGHTAIIANTFQKE